MVDASLPRSSDSVAADLAAACPDFDLEAVSFESEWVRAYEASRLLDGVTVQLAAQRPSEGSLGIEDPSGTLVFGRSPKGRPYVVFPQHARPLRDLVVQRVRGPDQDPGLVRMLLELARLGEKLEWYEPANLCPAWTWLSEDSSALRAFYFGPVATLSPAPSAAGLSLEYAPYCCPEEASALSAGSGTPAAEDHRSIVYTLGCVLHDLVEGPVQLSADRVPDFLRARARGVSPELSPAVPVSAPIRLLHDRLLARDRARRPRWGALIGFLETLLGDPRQAELFGVGAPSSALRDLAHRTGLVREVPESSPRAKRRRSPAAAPTAGSGSARPKPLTPPASVGPVSRRGGSAPETRGPSAPGRSAEGGAKLPPMPDPARAADKTAPTPTPARPSLTPRAPPAPAPEVRVASPPKRPLGRLRPSSPSKEPPPVSAPTARPSPEPPLPQAGSAGGGDDTLMSIAREGGGPSRSSPGFAADVTARENGVHPTRLEEPVAPWADPSQDSTDDPFDAETTLSSEEVTSPGTQLPSWDGSEDRTLAGQTPPPFVGSPETLPPGAFQRLQEQRSRLQIRVPEVQTTVEASRPQGAPVAPSAEAQTRPDIEADEDVQFTVYAPPAVFVAEWVDLLVFAHLAEARSNDRAAPDPVKVVESQARALLGSAVDDHRRVVQDSSFAIPREGEMTVVPAVAGVRFNPPKETFLWTEDVHRSEFRVQLEEPTPEGKVLRGTVTIFLGALIVGEVPLRLRASASSKEASIEPSIKETAQAYRQVFVSYAHRDAWIVEHVAAISRGLGDQYLRDVTHLRSGERWLDALKDLIQKADIFQLFWSSHSINSEHVMAEVDFALSLGRPNFVRPVYWEVPLPRTPQGDFPRPALEALHFQRLPGPEAPVPETEVGPEFASLDIARGPPPPSMSSPMPSENQRPAPARRSGGLMSRWGGLASAALALVFVVVPISQLTLRGPWEPAPTIALPMEGEKTEPADIGDANPDGATNDPPTPIDRETPRPPPPSLPRRPPRSPRRPHNVEGGTVVIRGFTSHENESRVRRAMVAIAQDCMIAMPEGSIAQRQRVRLLVEDERTVRSLTPGPVGNCLRARMERAAFISGFEKYPARISIGLRPKRP